MAGSPPRVATAVTYSKATLGKTAVSSKVHQTLPRVNCTPDGVRTPEQIAKIFNELQDNILSRTEAAATSRSVATVVLRNVALVNGVQANIAHTLGVPWAAYKITRSYSQGNPCLLSDASSVPQGLTLDKYLCVMPYIVSASSGVKYYFDIEISAA